MHLKMKTHSLRQLNALRLAIDVLFGSFLQKQLRTTIVRARFTRDYYKITQFVLVFLRVDLYLFINTHRIACE
jgi:hypothetical protein